MTGRAARVLLDELPVGELIEDDDGYVEFRILQRYREMGRRPVLGQWFEDQRHGTQRGARPRELPPFFANLIPEGALRLRLGKLLGVDPVDDFGFLCAVGRDLPGAVVVEPHDGDLRGRAVPPPSEPAVEPGLRFSLAGVQLKFSMRREGERLSVPGRDERGDWIVKIAFDNYPDLCANEWVTMQWARLAGFDVPETELRTLRDLAGAPHEADPDTPVFIIRRYDREPGNRRIHQEDFQQIVGRRPEGKYDDVTYDGLVLLASRIVGDDAYEEMLRRLAFIVASGNDDAHMKNWSVTYPNTYPHGIQAQLSPLYDQVFTAQWPQFSTEMALKLGGTKEFAAITIARFRELARRVHQSPDDAEQIVLQTVSQIVEVWNELREDPRVTPAYREALQRHWRKVPLLQPHALLI